MTASRNTSTARYNNPNHPSHPNNSVLKRTRGPINKRACQRCRQGKIKCDGDAESGKPCSNCDPQHCKYDNSPRKNKQVESLKLRLTVVEEQLLAITTDFSEQLNTKDLEKEILCLLYDSKDQFSVTYDSLFKRLKESLKQSRCVRNILPIIFELLKRIGEEKNANYVPELMKSLQRLVDFSDSLGRDASFLPFNLDLAQPYHSDPMMLQQPDVNMNQLNLNEDDSSDTTNCSFGMNDDVSGGPSTPPENHNQSQQQSPSSESKCFNNSNGINGIPHHVQNPSPIMTATTSAPSDFTTPSFFNVNYPSYYPSSDYSMNSMNVMENSNYGINFMATTTTSPTDETAWVNINN